MRERRVEHLTADIVEEHVDAVWAGALKPLMQSLVLVVDGSIEAKFVREVVTFLRSAGNAHHSAVLDTRNLSYMGTDRACRTRN